MPSRHDTLVWFGFIWWGMACAIPAGCVSTLTDPGYWQHRSALQKHEIEFKKWEARLKELNSQAVYTTSHGTKYHRRYHYAGKNSPVGLGDAVRRGLDPCSVCRPPRADIGDKPSVPGYHAAKSAGVVWVLTLLGCFFSPIICLSLSDRWPAVTVRVRKFLGAEIPEPSAGDVLARLETENAKVAVNGWPDRLGHLTVRKKLS